MVGAGAWGRALAVTGPARAGAAAVTLWAREPARVRDRSKAVRVTSATCRGEGFDVDPARGPGATSARSWLGAASGRSHRS